MKDPNLILEKLKGIREHEVMRDHATMKVGGVADFYFEAKTIDDIIKAVKVSIESEIPFFILGNGSNVIFSDYGFPGLVIKNMTNNFAFLKNESQVIADSGLGLQKLIMEATSLDLGGIDFLFGIPGTLGAAVYGNVGAYGQSIGDYVRSATILIPDHKNENGDVDPIVSQVGPEWFEFSYRSSKLKKQKGYLKPVILSVKLQLAQSQKEEIMRKLQNWRIDRQKTKPVGQSAGCIFKNPISPDMADLVGTGSKNMPEFPKERTAGYLLDKSGAKKLKEGGAKVSTQHANFILNYNNAKAQDVRQLAEQMRALVQQKYDINLEEEIEYIGQW